MLRHFIRIFLIFSVFIILFIIPHGSTYGANSVRWAQIDKGIASYAYRAGAMMVQKDKITSISQVYGSLMFDGTRWYVSTDPTKFPRSDYMGNMFLDSRGIVYSGGVRADYNEINTPYSYIFESTDGLNFTPVQRFVDVNGKGIIWNFTEDRYGNVWAGEYTTRTTTTGAHLWRRRPNGVWTNVVNWALPEYHIHNVYYDPYRDALYVAIGDQDHGILKLPSDKVNADVISASDFSLIVPKFADNTPVEVTAITSDAINIYVGMDMHSPYDTKTRAISIITDDNINQTINVSYPLAGCTVWNWADVDDAGNVIFSSRGINEWSCTNNYVNQIVVSSDHGSTWTVVKDFGSLSTSIGLAYTGLASHYASNWSGLYGGGNGWGGSSLRATIGKVIPTGTTFYVDGSNGVDWTNFGIDPLNPVKSLNYLELLNIQPGDTVQFINSNTYTNPLMVGWSGDDTTKISIRGNPMSTFTGGNVANPPAVAEAFESAKGSWNFYLNETGGTISADSSIVHSGAQSAKVVRATGRVSLELKNVAATNITEGSTMYLSYWLYYPADQTSNSDPGMLRIIDNSNYEITLRLSPLSGSNLLNEVVVNIPAWSSYYIPARQSLASGAWHKISIEDYLHPSNGSLKLYVDNTLWLNINGVKTVTAGGKLNSIYFYNYERPVTYYIDDLNFGKSPIEARGAIFINGYSYLDIGSFRFQGTNGIILSGNSTDITIHNSIFDRLTSDAIASRNSANLNFYYNSIYGSGRYGVYTSGTGSFINNVVYNSSANDIFIEAGTSVIGSNNWFMDSGYAGTGTYLDTGNTTWSGADPAFVDPGSGDFHLLSTSPLIDIGTPIDGFIFDFDGSIRPQGSAPDIGAYETPAQDAYILTVNKDGTGVGSVLSFPTGIDCGDTCIAAFDLNTEVILTAVASDGSIFAGWSGGECSGIDVCVVTMNTGKSITATFISSSINELTVNKTGSGIGTVTSEPSGIDCGETCTADFAYNTVVALTATASTGSTFAGWSLGECTGTDVCTVTMNMAKSVTAMFTLNNFPLTVNKVGNGSGTVVSIPAGIDCGSMCTVVYPYNTLVTLTAVSDSGSLFTGWSGSECSGTGACMVTMDAAKDVIATFALMNDLTLTVNKTGPGSGTVTSVPLGIDCGETCSANFDYNTMVTLTAVANAGSTFTGWTGSGCSGTDTCIVRMDMSRSVTATFAIDTFTLSINKSGSGSGIVMSDPTGIDCGETCAANFDYNTVVTLTATASIGSTFTGWNGSGCSGTGVCVVMMDTSRSITATFTIDTYTLSVTSEGTGSGTVTSIPPGIICGETCSADFDYNTVITLTASASTSSIFMGWSGSGCSGTGECVVTMDSGKSVVAIFSLKTYALTVNKTGPGSGTVTSVPSGINCGLTCKANFTYSTVVSLTATPASGSIFTGWKGSGCTGTGVCVVIMDAAKSVSATFKKIR